MDDSIREILILLFQSLRKQQDMLMQLSSATRALVKALEETDDDVALRYSRYHQVARRALELQPKSEMIELERAIHRLEGADLAGSLALAAEGN